MKGITIFGLILLAIAIVLGTGLLNVYLGALLLMEYAAWFIPSWVPSYTESLGYVCFSTLIFAAAKYGLARSDNGSSKGEDAGEKAVIQISVLGFGWTLGLGILWCAGWFYHWFFFT